MRRPPRPRIMLFVLLAGFLLVAGLPALLKPDLLPSSLRTTFSPARGPAAQILYRAESNSPFDTGPPDREALKNQFETALHMMTSPNVLASVVSNPSIIRIDAIKHAASAEDLIREALFIRNFAASSTLIEVSSRGFPPNDAATIINAVVDAWLEVHRESDIARHRQSIEQLEAYLEQLSEEAESLSQDLRTLDTLQLEPEGPPLSRAAAEVELLDCLGRIRDLRLERAGLGDDPTNADALASIDRREALLIADRDRIAQALSQPSDVASNATQTKLDHLNLMREQVRNRLEELRFETQGSERFHVISPASARTRP